MVQSQRVSEKLTRTVALQRVQSAQETMICSYWYYLFLRLHCSPLTGTSVGLLVTCQCPLTADKKGKLGRAIYTVSGLSWLSLSTSRRNGLEVGGLVGAISPQLLTLLSSLVVMG